MLKKRRKTAEANMLENLELLQSTVQEKMLKFKAATDKINMALMPHAHAQVTCQFADHTIVHDE